MRTDELRDQMRDTVAGPISLVTCGIGGALSLLTDGAVPIWLAMPVGAILGFLAACVAMRDRR